MNIITIAVFITYVFFKKSSFKHFRKILIMMSVGQWIYWWITYKTVINDFLIIPKIKSRVQLSTGCSLRLNFLELIASL